MDKKSFLASGLLKKYVLGLATPEECEEVISHLKKYPELKSHLTTLESGISDYAAKQGIPELPASRPARATAGIGVLIIGLFFLASTVAAGVFYNQGKVARKNYANAIASLEACRQQLVEEQSVRESLKNFQAFFNDTASLPLTLVGKTDETRILIYWNEMKGEARLKLLRLPNPPEKMQYQAWADIAGEMVSIGLVQYHFGEWQDIACLKNAKSVNITLEPEGGSQQPSVDYLFANAEIRK